jgi:hypothetical protein
VYVHLDKGKLPQLPYLQVAIIFWAAELLVRTYRIARWNVGINKDNGKPGVTTSVLVEALQGEACRVTFTMARDWRWEPGCHVYVCLPGIEAAFHPFSVAWAHVPQAVEEQGGQVVENPFADPDEEFEMDELSKGGAASTVVASSSHTAGTKQHPTSMSRRKASLMATKVSLLIRPHSGFTRKLYTMASSTPQKLLATTGIIDGPYPSHCDLDHFGTVLLFAAGVGITHQLGFVYHLVRGYAEQTVCAKKVVLVWSIQTLESLAWIQSWLDVILAVPRYREVLHLRIFVTRGLLYGLNSSSGTLRMATGRCKPQEIVDEVFEGRVGKMVVTVCGPGAFNDAVRSAVRTRVTDGALEFMEEGFSY